MSAMIASAVCLARKQLVLVVCRRDTENLPQCAQSKHLCCSSCEPNLSPIVFRIDSSVEAFQAE